MSAVDLSERCSVTVKYGKYLEFTKFYQSNGNTRYIKYSHHYYNALKDNLSKLADWNTNGTADFIRIKSSDRTQDFGHDYLFRCSHYQGEFFTGLFYCGKDSEDAEKVGGGLNLTPGELLALNDQIDKVDNLWKESSDTQSSSASPSKRQRTSLFGGIHELVEISLYGYRGDGLECKWFASKELAYKSYKEEYPEDTELPKLEEINEPPLNVTHVIRILYYHKLRNIIIPGGMDIDDSELFLLKGRVQVKEFTTICKAFFDLINHRIDSIHLYVLCYSCIQTALETFPIGGNYKFYQLAFPQ